MRTEYSSPILPSSNSARLNSWKEIAAFFEKDVRTVRRWEATRRLPVHRVPGGGRSGVFAYAWELERWLTDAGRDPQEFEPPAEEQIHPIPTPLASSRNPTVAQEGAPAFLSAPSHAFPPQALPLRDSSLPVVSTAEHVLPLTEAPATALASSTLPIAASRQQRWYRFAVPLTVLLAVVSFFIVRQRRQAPAQNDTRLTSLASGRPSANAEAQELYLRGVYLLNQRTATSIASSIDLFTQAIVCDPDFAAAYAGLADSYILLRQYGRMKDSDAFPRALGAARAALNLDETSPEAHRAYAFLLNYWLWNSDEAFREFHLADRLKPGDAPTHHWYATSLYSTGRYPEALEQINIAQRLQPDSIVIMVNRGLLLSAIDNEKGLAYLLEVEKINAQFAPVHIYLADCYARRRQFEPFLAELRQVAILRNDSDTLAILDRGRAELQRAGSAAMLRLVGEEFAAKVDAGRSDAMQVAFYFTLIGEKPRALHYMRLAGERHEANFIKIDEDPIYKALADQPGYAELLAMRRTPLTLKAALRIGGPILDPAH